VAFQYRSYTLSVFPWDPLLGDSPRIPEGSRRELFRATAPSNSVPTRSQIPFLSVAVPKLSTLRRLGRVPCDGTPNAVPKLADCAVVEPSAGDGWVAYLPCIAPRPALKSVVDVFASYFVAAGDVRSTGV